MKHNQQSCNLFLSLMIAFVLAVPAYAGEVGALTSFTAGTPAVAAEVNGNFTAVKTAVDDNHARIAALEARIAALEAKLTSVSVVTHNGQPTVRFSGVNVQVVNGAGTTDTTNGRGNLIVGYDAPRTGTGWEVCSDGQYIDQITCEANGGTWAVNHKSGSHNIVGGDGNSYSSFGGLAVGQNNVTNRDYASVTGGAYNTANGRHASVSGGGANAASGNVASVSGGNGNTASGSYASVSGGRSNTASGSTGFASTSVNGGYNNTASHDYSSILGGSTQSTSSSSQTIPALP